MTKEHWCPSCGKLFKKPSLLIRHQESMHVHKEYLQCHLCSARSKTKYSLDIHMTRLHKCRSCNAELKTPEDRKNHLKIHPTPPKPRVVCQVCNKSVTTAQQMKLHMNIHTGERPFICQICPKTFATPTALSRHLKIHTGEKPFKCGYCPKAFAVAGDRRKHWRVHTKVTPFSCIFCQKEFKFISAINSHYRTHLGERPFNCNICSKEFAHATHLNGHLRAHTGEKFFKCGRCQRAFTFKSKRDQHERAKCQVVRNISCVFCEWTFSQAGNYYNHIRSHVGEKPFHCRICSVHFSQTRGLNKHMRLVHTGEK